MEIRYLRETDDRHEISRMYEEGWKYTYKDIISRKYLDSIPKRRWARGLMLEAVAGELKQRT